MDSGPQLPQELLDIIVDIVSNDKPTLYALLNTARCFKYRVHSYLYRHVDVGTKAHINDSETLLLFRRTATFRDLITNTNGKDIIQHVRHLSCQLNDSEDTQPTDMEMMWDTLRQICAELNALETMQLHFISWSWHMNLHDAYVARLKRCLSSPSVTTLVLGCYDTSIHAHRLAWFLKEAYPNLASLHLDGVQVKAAVGDLGDALAAPTEVEVRLPIDLFALYSPYMGLVHPFALDKLRRLIIYDAIMLDLEEFAKVVPATLVEFYSLVRIDMSSAFLPQLLDVPSLVLCFDSQSHVSWFSGAPFHQNTPFRVKNLGIVIPADRNNRYTVGADISSHETAWCHLAEILLSPCFSELESVCVTFLYDMGAKRQVRLDEGGREKVEQYMGKKERRDGRWEVRVQAIADTFSCKAVWRRWSWGDFL